MEKYFENREIEESNARFAGVIVDGCEHYYRGYLIQQVTRGSWTIKRNNCPVSKAGSREQAEYIIDVLNPVKGDKAMIKLSDYENSFLPADGETCFLSLDGSDVARWLESIGETVVKYYDTGRNGRAVTASGYYVSTNGYVHR